MRRLSLFLAALLVPVLPCMAAQQDAGRPSFRVNAHSVLVDVVVTDSHGKPITGLPKSAFHVSDNGRPQTIASFDAHTGGLRPGSQQLTPRARPETGASPVQNVLLIDTSKMNLLLQMSLYKQLIRFVQTLPPNMPIAIFWRSHSAPVLLQNFTTDHALLQAAISKAIPHLQIFGAGTSLPEADDFRGPQWVAYYLAQIPGRKNLLWFIGMTDASGTLAMSKLGISPDAGPLNDDLRRTYDQLQQGRVSVYLIDVRGLNAGENNSAPSDHLREDGFAEGTGGKAFYNANDLTLAADQAVDDGENFYTLSYSPDDLRNNGSWHAVHVDVEGGSYRLSYRPGYYDDESQGRGKPAPTRTSMIAVKNSNIAEPDSHSDPLFFRVKAIRVGTINNIPPKRGFRYWKVHYDIPASELEHGFTNGVAAAEAGAAVVVFSQEGWVLSDKSQKVTLKFTEAAYKAEPNAALSFDQTIQLPEKTPTYLYVALWDATTGRMGTADLAVDERKHKTK